MRPTLAFASIEAVARSHRAGHKCADGKWFNDQTGTRSPCPVLLHLQTAADQVQKLHDQVHEAAHHDPTVYAVVEGMTGFTADDLAQMGADERDGWVLTARRAIETLAYELDRDPTQEARAAAVRERLQAAAT